MEPITQYHAYRPFTPVTVTFEQCDNGRITMSKHGLWFSSGLVDMAACSKELRGMGYFDTPEQAHAEHLRYCAQLEAEGMLAPGFPILAA